jgi:hypothetical protein
MTNVIFDLDGVTAQSTWQPPNGVIYQNRRAPSGINPNDINWFVGNRWAQFSSLYPGGMNTHANCRNHLLHHGLTEFSLLPALLRARASDDTSPQLTGPGRASRTFWCSRTRPGSTETRLGTAHGTPIPDRSPPTSTFSRGSTERSWATKSSAEGRAMAGSSSMSSGGRSSPGHHCCAVSWSDSVSKHSSMMTLPSPNGG